MRCPHNRTDGDAGVSAPYFTQFVEGRRGEILDAALQVFGEKGYEAGTMREIAARVGVTEPALYRHYSGKEALLLDLVAKAGDRITAEAEVQLKDFAPIDLRASLMRLLHVRRQGVSDSKQVMRTIMDAAPHNVALKGTFREKFGRPMMDNVTQFIDRVDESFGIERSPAERKGRLRAFMSLFIGYFMTSMFFGEELQDDAIIDAMLAIMDWNEPAVSE